MYNNEINVYGIWKWLLFGKSLQVILFHCFLAALVISISKWFYALWIGILVIGYLVSKFQIQLFLAPFLFANFLTAEVFVRALKLSPILPYEFGKYITVILLTYLIIRTKIRASISSRSGRFIIFLILPSLFITVLYGHENIFKEFVFNGLGIINLALAIIFFGQYKISIQNLHLLLQLIIISALPFIIWSALSTPDFSSIDFNLNSSGNGIGGFSSNQISTLFGFVFSVGIFQIIHKYYFLKNSILTFCISMGFLFSALVSFSRGGIIVAFIALILVVYIVRKEINKRVVSGFFLFVPLLSTLLYFTNKLTNNTLLLRYQGETNSSLAGRSEKSLNSLTTGRYNILINDLNIWSDNLFFGTGIGQSPKFRTDYGEDYIISHVEFSRLLAEHGIFGLLIIITIIMLTIIVIKDRKSVLGKSFAVFCFTVSILTSFHAAMRTNITPILLGLGMIQIIQNTTKNRH